MRRVPTFSAAHVLAALTALLVAAPGGFATEAIPPDPLDAEAIPPDPVPDGPESTVPVRDGRALAPPARRPVYHAPPRVYIDERDVRSPFSFSYRPTAALPPHCRARLPPDFSLGASGTLIVSGRTLAAETVIAIDPDSCYLGVVPATGDANATPRRWLDPLMIDAYSRDRTARDAR